MTTRALDPVLARQLKRLKIDTASSVSGLPDEVWPQLLEQLNEHYHHMNDDRALLNRSLELSTGEMDSLRRRVEHQRDSLSMVVGAIGEALSDFGSIVQADSNTGTLTSAKAEFTARLQRILNESDIGDEQTSEVSLIRTNLARLADQLIVLLADTAERAALKKELEVARAVQQLLVPSEDVIDRPRVQIAGMFEPAAECGGDWWNVADLADERLLTIVGDVTGHGVASAILTGAAKAACDLAIDVTAGKLEATELLSMMNIALYRTGRRQVMMTCLATVIDPASGLLTIANAGHPNPILIRKGVIHPLLAEGAPLGASPDSTYRQVQIRYEPGDVLVCFTDGIVECENPRGEQFSERRLRAISQRAAAGGAVSVRKSIVEALASFRSDVPQADDLTFVAIAFK